MPAPVSNPARTISSHVPGWQLMELEFPRLSSDLARVSQTIMKEVGAAPHRAREPIGLYIRYSGRLFRPSLALIASYLGSGDSKQPAPADVVRVAAAAEMLHVATLYHDDLIDKAVTRRGGASINVTFGEETTILAGDFLLAAAMGLTATVGAEVTGILARTLQALCNGQFLESLDLFNIHRDRSDYLTSITGKTASLMGASLELGVAAYGAPRAICEAFQVFGTNLGVAFQIMDDVRDITESVKSTGKAAGKDLRNGVYTLPVIHGMQHQPELLSRLLPEIENDPARLDDIQRILRECGAFDKSIQEANGYLIDALELIDELDGDCMAGGLRPRLLEIARIIIPELGSAGIGSRGGVKWSSP